MPECSFHTMPGPSAAPPATLGMRLRAIVTTVDSERSALGHRYRPHRSQLRQDDSCRGARGHDAGQPPRAGSGTKVTAGEPAYTADRPGWRGSRVVPGTLPGSRNLGTAGQLLVVAACRRGHHQFDACRILREANRQSRARPPVRRRDRLTHPNATAGAALGSSWRTIRRLGARSP